jgi:hypothetical protein
MQRGARPKSDNRAESLVDDVVPAMAIAPFARVPGDAMSRKKRRASSQTRMVPFGDTLGRPSGVTVAAKHRWADWITARMSGVSVWPPCLTSCQVTTPAPGRVIASYGTAQFPTTGFHVESGL